jgi:hypothetical protein
MPTPDDHSRRAEFESLCLSGIWLLIRLAVGLRSMRGVADWRDRAVTYLDDHGHQGEAARERRRGSEFEMAP